MRKNHFWSTKIGAILIATSLCLGFLGQAKITEADASQPAMEQSSNQQSNNENNDPAPAPTGRIDQVKKPNLPSSDLSIVHKNFDNQTQANPEGPVLPMPNYNSSIQSAPSLQNVPDVKIDQNPEQPLLPTLQIDLNKQKPADNSITTNARLTAKKSKSESKEAKGQAQSKSRISEKQATKTKKVYYANIFQAKETNNENKKTGKQQQKKTISGLTADVVNKKGQKVGYVDKHDRVHLEKLAYSGKMDSPSLTIGLVALLAAGLLTSIGLANGKRRI